MAEEILKIRVDDGYRKIPIENEFGDEVGIFYFNPSDVGIVKRFNEVSGRFSKVSEPLQNLKDGIEANGTGITDEDIAASVAKLPKVGE